MDCITKDGARIPISDPTLIFTDLIFYTTINDKRNL